VDAELQHAVAQFGRKSDRLLLVLDPYRPEAFPIGEFLFGLPATEFIDQECARACETSNLDRLIALMGKPFGGLTAMHSDHLVGMEKWLDDLGRFLMTKKMGVDMLAITDRPEVKAMADKAIETSKSRDKFVLRVVGK
jgi:hypothetical protein